MVYRFARDERGFTLIELLVIEGLPDNSREIVKKVSIIKRLS